MLAVKKSYLPLSLQKPSSSSQQRKFSFSSSFLGLQDGAMPSLTSYIRKPLLPLSPLNHLSTVCTMQLIVHNNRIYNVSAFTSHVCKLDGPNSVLLYMSNVP